MAKFCERLHHFVRHQISVKTSRNGLLCSLFLRLIGESVKMPLASEKLSFFFDEPQFTQLLLPHEAI